MTRRLAPSKHHVSLTGQQRSAKQQAATRTVKQRTIAIERALKEAEARSRCQRSWWITEDFYRQAKAEQARMAASKDGRATVLKILD